MKTWSDTKDKRKLRRIYMQIIPKIRDVARESGYAIGVHGSMTRDLDLIAAPWVKKCVSPQVLARRIEEAVCQYPLALAYHMKAVRNAVGKKPHGRLAISLYVGMHAYIDLSVMPPSRGER